MSADGPLPLPEVALENDYVRVSRDKTPFASVATDRVIVAVAPLSFMAGGRADTAVTLAAASASTPASFDAAVAANAGRPILVSFKADWCTVCKSNEAVMAQPPVAERLQAMPVIDVDVTSQDENARALMSRFSVVGPPTMFLLDAAGHEIPGSRMIGPIDAEDITSRLSRAGA